MKSIFTISFILLSVQIVFAQDYMNVIVERSCACVDKVPDTLSVDQFNMGLGVCMIEASLPYKKQIKKDFQVDLDKIETEGEKLGRLIGVKMASVCPDALLRVTRKSSGKKELSRNAQTSGGIVTKIENDFFVAFSVKDETGKISKYYWLTPIETESDLIGSYETLLGKSVIVTYESMELFDPRIKEYRAFLVIKKLH